MNCHPAGKNLVVLLRHLPPAPDCVGREFTINITNQGTATPQMVTGVCAGGGIVVGRSYMIPSRSIFASSPPPCRPELSGTPKASMIRTPIRMSAPPW